ncbi:MAG: hypothetical protein Dbin4_01653, partial [Alphaproteobacteria bacterium]|nr:hypothetical protein [Alphaproteobacteria bacterium]
LEDAELVIVDGALSAVQQRNLEEALKRKVIDRTGLILEIFGERAATAEGRLIPRLIRRAFPAGRKISPAPDRNQNPGKFPESDW